MSGIALRWGNNQNSNTRSKYLILLLAKLSSAKPRSSHPQTHSLPMKMDRQQYNVKRVPIYCDSFREFIIYFMLAPRPKCMPKNLPIIHESQQRIHKEQSLHKIKNKPQNITSLIQRKNSQTSSTSDDIETKEINQIVELCEKNPFYRSKMVHALKAAKYSVRPQETLKDKEILASKISTFRCESTNFQSQNTLSSKKVNQLMKQLKLEEKNRA